MKKSLFMAVVLLFAMSSFGDTIINNFNGYSDYWNPFGNPNTSTYGEVFTAPTGSDTNLSSMSFYMGDALTQGNILLGAYVATWTGSHAGTLLYDSGAFNYDNAGNEKLTWNPNVTVTPGSQYVMFLSVSGFYGQSSGTSYVVPGNSDPNLNGFAYYNNGGDFNSLFTNNWDGTGLTPDWAVDLQFNQVPEPSSLLMLGTGILGGIGVLRRKLF